MAKHPKFVPDTDDYTPDQIQALTRYAEAVEAVSASVTKIQDAAKVFEQNVPTIPDMTRLARITAEAAGAVARRDALAERVAELGIPDDAVFDAVLDVVA